MFIHNIRSFVLNKLIVPYSILNGFFSTGVLAVLCCVAFWFMPETTGKDLPQTIGEFENLFHKKSDSQNKREDLVIENCN